jgi:hypothetical protein
VDEVRAVLSEGDEQRVKDVRAYERNHKARAGVIQATESELSKPEGSIRAKGKGAASGPLLPGHLGQRVGVRRLG